MRTCSSPLSLALLTLLLPACGGDKATEGQNAGECTDGADNDADGTFDCDDTDCDGSPDCGEDTGNADSNAAPSGVAIAITPATPGPDDALSCTVTTEAVDPDGDTVSYRYAWTVDGVSAGVTEATVASSLTEGGQTWTCTVTPTDGMLDGTSASASVTVEPEAETSQLGSSSSNPGTSCKAILDAGDSVGDGSYWVTYGRSTPFRVDCEMTTDGGGWALAWLHDGVTDYNDSAIAYDMPVVAQSATTTMIAYVDSTLRVLSNWASFPVPSAWRTNTPMNQAPTDLTTDATIAGVLRSGVALRFGRSDFGSQTSCGSFIWTSGNSGAVCLNDAEAPWFARFAGTGGAYLADTCATGFAYSAANVCGPERRFAIWMR